MNFLFLTQSKSLALFHRLGTLLQKKGDAGTIGYYLSDSSFYDSFRKDFPEIDSPDLPTLKEWNILGKAALNKPDLSKLKAFEEKYGDPYLWNAIVADRRIYGGRKITLEQDYSQRFSHEQMMSILQTTIEELEAFFDRIRPDAVVSFICVTIGEYLAYLICRARNIRFINLRPTRVKNYFFAGESVLEPSEELERFYRFNLDHQAPAELKKQVEDYLQDLRQSHAMYEGVIAPPGKTILKSSLSQVEKKTGRLKRLLGLTRTYYDYTYGQYRHDNAHRGVFYPIWAQKVKLPQRVRSLQRRYEKEYIQVTDLPNLDYAFYPLHKEPEVTLLVYGRPYLNQIEVIRNMARSLPIGMTLLVKEHPAALGYRSEDYYRKIINIPNVRLAHPGIASRDLVSHAKLISIISGSIGLEAIMMKKPVIAFGRTPFGFLPITMIQTIKSLDSLPENVHDMLHHHQHDEAALVAFVAAVMEHSVPVDFYSVLLGRSGVYRPGQSVINDEIYQTHLSRLSQYILQRSHFSPVDAFRNLSVS